MPAERFSASATKPRIAGGGETWGNHGGSSAFLGEAEARLEPKAAN